MLPITVQFVVAMVAHSLNERMARKAEYLCEENRVLKEAVRAATGKTRITLTHEQLSVDVLGLVRHMVFFVIELWSRAVHVTGIRIDPNGAWMMQAARNLFDPVDGFLRNATHLIHDRDPLFTKAWTALLKSSGAKCAPIPVHSPNRSPHAERFVKTMRTECLDQFVIFGEPHLRYLANQFVDHYHLERNHQGLGNRLIEPVVANTNVGEGRTRRRQRVGGLLNFYYHDAA